MMNQDIAACASLVERGDADRFLAIMSAPVAMREKLFPLYAFNVEVARAPWVTQETMIAEMRLQWWRDALEEIGAKGGVRRHEVVTPLSEILSEKHCALLDTLIEARRWDVYKDGFEDEAHFQRYLDQTAGNLLVVAADLLGQADDESAVRKVAYADGLARWFQAIPKLEDQQRVPLIDGRHEALVALAQEALDDLKVARKTLRNEKEIAPVLRTAWQSEAILRQVVKTPALVSESALGTSDFYKKISLLGKSLMSSW